MLRLRHPRRWHLASGLLLLAVLAIALSPDILARFLGEGPGTPHLDKWLHGLTFVLLALWFSGQYARESYGWIVLGLAAYGGIIELGQSMIPYRTAECGDLAADCAGILAGMMIALAGAGGWGQRLEPWLERRFG